MPIKVCDNGVYCWDSSIYSAWDYVIELKEVKFRPGIDDHDFEALTDDDGFNRDSSGWGIDGGQGKAHAAVFQLANLQFTHQGQLDRLSSWSGNATVQASRQTTQTAGAPGALVPATDVETSACPPG